MRPHPALLPLATLLLLATGCSLFQPHTTSPVDRTTDPACEWTTVRGVAELIRIEDNEAVMDFFPGAMRFRTSADNPDWAAGDEFKVLLETSDHPECDAPRVLELSPVGPDA